MAKAPPLAVASLLPYQHCPGRKIPQQLVEVGMDLFRERNVRLRSASAPALGLDFGKHCIQVRQFRTKRAKSVPCRARERAKAWPIPRLAPATSEHFPSHEGRNGVYNLIIDASLKERGFPGQCHGKP